MSKKVSRFMARQFSNPSGLFGRLVTSRLLNRANQPSNAAVLELLDVQPDSRVLEVGFGGGDLLFNISERLSGGSIQGLEISRDMLKHCENKALQLGRSHYIRLQLGTVESMPFDDQEFDRLCSVNTVYFWPELTQSITELNRVTRPGGILVLGFGSSTALREAGYEQQGFILRTPEQIRTALSEAGFHKVQESILERKKRGDFYVFKYRKAD